MTLLTFEEFAILCPPGTIFSFADPMSPDNRRGLYRKVETLSYEDKPSDFTYIDLLPQSDWSGSPYDYDPETYSLQFEPCDLHRWGEYDYDIKYIVFDAEDLEKLKNAL